MNLSFWITSNGAIPPQGQPTLSLVGLGMSGLTKPAVVVLHATFPLVTVSMQKT